MTVKVASPHGEGSVVTFVGIKHSDVAKANRLVREWLYEGKYEGKHGQAAIELENLRQRDPIHLGVRGQEATGDVPAGDWIVFVVGDVGIKTLGSVVSIDSSDTAFFLDFSKLSHPASGTIAD